MSRILIITDLEGCVGVTDMDAARFPPAKGKEFLANHYREICTKETLAAIEGLQEGGYDCICVYESHPCAVLERELPEHIEFRRGTEE